MALTVSTAAVDDDGRELLTYGTPEFPVAFFYDDFHIVTVPWHWHEELELILVTKGRQRVFIGSRVAELAEGDGYFCNSGILHHAEPLTPECEQEAIVANARVIGEPDSVYYRNYMIPLLRDRGLPSRILQKDVSSDQQILQWFHTAWKAGSMEEEGYELTVRSLLGEIFFRLEQESRTDRIDSDGTSGSGRDEERIKAMIGFIKGHFRENISIASIAESANLSVSEGLRCFHKTLSTTPMQFVNGYRLGRAVEMLCTSETPIADIAEACGYQDPAYFARAFRRQYHMTPREYRNLYGTRTS